METDIEKEYLEKRKIKRVYIEGEKVYMKKSFFGWSVVHPCKTDGKINLKNLIAGGNWIKLGIILFIVILILGCIYEYTTALKIANDCLEKVNTFPY